MEDKELIEKIADRLADIFGILRKIESKDTNDKLRADAQEILDLIRSAGYVQPQKTKWLNKPDSTGAWRFEGSFRVGKTGVSGRWDFIVNYSDDYYIVYGDKILGLEVFDGRWAKYIFPCSNLVQIAEDQTPPENIYEGFVLPEAGSAYKEAQQDMLTPHKEGERMVAFRKIILEWEK